PACGYRDDITTACQILSQAHVFLGEAVGAMQENDGWEGSSTAWARDCCEHDAETGDRNVDPLHCKALGAGWCVRLVDRDSRRRAGAALGCLCRSTLDWIQRDQHGDSGERCGKLQPHHFAVLPIIERPPPIVSQPALYEWRRDRSPAGWPDSVRPPRW